MTKRIFLPLAALSTVIILCGQIRAERMREDPKDATHVVTGTVQRVFSRETASQTQYIVEIKVNQVERPATVKPGELLSVYCFQAKEIKPVQSATPLGKAEAILAPIRESGHTAIPKEGQQIRALAKPRHGRLEALYPDWFSLVGGVASSLPSAHAKPQYLKVFILAGQSNMVGHGKVDNGRSPDYDESVKGSTREVRGGIGSLRHMAKDPATADKFGHFLNADGTWAERDDVFIYSTAPGKDKGRLSVGFGKGNWFGPELGFGNVMGDHFDEPVLIIKTAWGGKDLAVDFRPPSSGDTDLKKDREVGAFYKQMMSIVRDRLTTFESDFSELKGCKPEIVGFGWHQGWNDGCSKEMTAEYEQNMVNFINDVRKELGVENLPFVIANTGQNGNQTKGTFAELCQAQLHIGDATKHPEFEGTVTSIDTRPFKAPEERSPSGFGYHWNHSGEAHYKVGESMGQAMVGLLSATSAKGEQ